LKVYWLLAAMAGGLAAAAVAIPLGWILLRLRGPYFAIAMLGFAAALEVITASWDALTGGGKGINLPPSLNLMQVYFAMAIAMLTVIGLSYRILTSRYGLRLMAIREDEEAAEAMGINTTAHKVSAFVISAFFPGVLGGIYAWHLAYIDPNSVFRPIISIGMVIMAMFGGVGTVLGPVIGGLILNILGEVLWARFTEVHRGIYGLMIIVVVLLMPGGLLSVLRTRGLIPRSWRL
jgi:branched-chain amino acid transport system permease protein